MRLIDDGDRCHSKDRIGRYMVTYLLLLCCRSFIYYCITIKGVSLQPLRSILNRHRYPYRRKHTA